MFRKQVISNAELVPMSVTAETRLDRAVQAGASRLLELQRPDDWWVGELESNVTITAQHLLFHEFMRVRTEEMTSGIVDELLAQQRPDGLWSIYRDGEPDLHATIESYAALRLAGFSPGDPKLEPARQFCLEHGGIGGTRAFTRMWLALFGVWPWEEIPQLLPEFIFLSPRLPVSLYTFACWARQTVGALTIVMHYRPVHRLPPARAIHELNLGPVTPTGLSDRAWGTGNRLAAWYLSHQSRPGAAKALASMEQWVLDRQELDGSWGGIQPPWVWSLIALTLRGHGPESPALRRGLEGWNRFMVEDGDRLCPEACQSPVWDTALALLGLEASGLTIETGQLRRAASLVVREEVRARGDWSIRAPGVEPAGWAFEYDNDNYPDIDDVAIVGLALDKLGVGRSAVDRACVWLKGMQSSNGGWGAFDIDNDAEWLYSLPFCDFGAVVDPPSADVTAHVVELLATRPGFERPVERGVDYLLREQQADGSWFGSLGRQLHLRDRSRVASTAGCRISPGAPCNPARGAMGQAGSDRRWRLWRGLPLVQPRSRRPLLAWTWAVDAVADRVGAPRPCSWWRSPVELCSARRGLAL